MTDLERKLMQMNPEQRQKAVEEISDMMGMSSKKNGCANKAEDNQEKDEKFIFKTEPRKLKAPKNPKRIEIID